MFFRHPVRCKQSYILFLAWAAFSFNFSVLQQVVKGTKIFERGVQFLGNWTLDSMIDGVNITELYQNAMTLHGNQTITGYKVSSI